MAKSKKTKIHKKIDGQILQMNKQFSNLKMKQKDKITEWVYEEYKKYVTEHDKAPSFDFAISITTAYTIHPSSYHHHKLYGFMVSEFRYSCFS